MNPDRDANMYVDDCALCAVECPNRRMLLASGHPRRSREAGLDLEQYEVLEQQELIIQAFEEEEDYR